MAETTQTTSPPGHPGKVPAPPSGTVDGGDVGGRFLTRGQLVRRRFLRHRAAMTALTILVAFVVFVYVAPFFLGYSLTNLSAGSYEDPSPAHVFGTDQVGADVFSLVMKGAQLSLQIGVLATVIAWAVTATCSGLRRWLRDTRRISPRACPAASESFVPSTTPCVLLSIAATASCVSA